MFSAIQNEVNKINNPHEEDTEDKTIGLEQEYARLERVKTDLENLDTNSENDYLSDDDFNKLKELVVSGSDLVEAYRNILPTDLIQYTKKTIKDYEEDLISIIVDSDTAQEYRDSLQFIIDGLSTIYDDKEYTFKKLKEIFDNKYN